MAGSRKNQRQKDTEKTNPVPPGATKAASDHDLRPGEPPDRTPSGEEAVGTPGGGTEVGGLAGTNIDDGDPVLTNLDRAMGSDARGEDSEEGEPPYAGPSGGSVGGTPAQRRASGGHQRHGFSPGGAPHGDSTVGRDPTPHTRQKK
ncbi:MAG TPA: hypothetical protein VMF69_12700 [Gemmataceae bacterium]|nr:hypothetical protein [Gemmataceae bacterium]